MDNEAKVIEMDDLKREGVQLIYDTPGAVIVDGQLITEDMKKSFVTISEADKAHWKAKHARLTEEGMQKKGAKRGRKSVITEELGIEILRLSDLGLSSYKIVQQIEVTTGRVLNRRTVDIYLHKHGK